MRPPQSLDDPASLSFADLVKQQQSASSSQTEGRGDLLLAYGSCLLRKFRDKLGDALWGVLETVYLQALEFRQDRWATYCLQALQTRWRDSTRVKRLKGIALEAQGQWAAALCHYDSLLSQQPHDPLTRKRVTAALKNQVKKESRNLNHSRVFRPFAGKMKFVEKRNGSHCFLEPPSVEVQALEKTA
ncbi:tetratricopeptide repeat-containing protein, partial [Toxoplasma gondii ARI]